MLDRIRRGINTSEDDIDAIEAEIDLIDAELDAIDAKILRLLENRLDTNSNELMEYVTTGSAVNHWKWTNAATGNGPLAEATGSDTNVSARIAAKGTGTIKVGGATHHTEFEADGTLHMVGDATVWEDMRVPVTATNRGGSKDPTFSVFKDNGGGSQGVFLDWFSASSEQELYFACQFSHAYKLGSTIYPHVHWVPAASGTNKHVSWGLEYTWVDTGATYGNTAIIYGDTPSDGTVNLVAGRSYLTNLTAIVGSGISGVSSMLVGRVFRDATGAGGTDDLAATAGLMEIDFHYEVDTIGSRTVTAK